MDKRFIYADNAATTAVSDEVLQAMLPYFREGFGNASCIYKLGRDAQKSVETAREKVATAIGADGLIIEVHNDPTHALCDGAQSLTPAQFDEVARKVKALKQIV